MSLLGYSNDQVLPFHPPVGVKDVRHTADYIISGKDANANRKIYYGVPFSKFEEEMLTKFEEVVVQNSLVYPADWERPDGLHLLYNSEFDFKKIINMTRDHFAWRSKPKPMPSEAIALMVRLVNLRRTRPSCSL